MEQGFKAWQKSRSNNWLGQQSSFRMPEGSRSVARVKQLPGHLDQTDVALQLQLPHNLKRR